jgi:hypothetical protein
LTGCRCQNECLATPEDHAPDTGVISHRPDGAFRREREKLLTSVSELAAVPLVELRGEDCCLSAALHAEFGQQP